MGCGLWVMTSDDVGNASRTKGLASAGQNPTQIKLLACLLMMLAGHRLHLHLHLSPKYFPTFLASCQTRQTSPRPRPRIAVL